MLDSEKRTLDIGCGFHSEHKKRGVIGIDLRRGLCDAVADAQYLPFRQAIFDEVHLISVLEHLDYPKKCLKEALYVAKNDASFQILVPVEARYLPLIFRMIIFGFPFGMLSSIRLCKDIRKHRRFKGSLHSNCIQPHDILPFFGEATLTKEIGISHPWFHGRKGKILRKILGNYVIRWGADNWVIKAKKTEKNN